MNHNDATPCGKPAAVGDSLTGSLKKRQAQTIEVPNYDDIELDSDGAAFLPCDFLPTMVDKLPEQWFYATYRWYKYFDKEQRPESGGVASSKTLDVADPNSMAK